jgi:hypothetical protein
MKHVYFSLFAAIAILSLIGSITIQPVSAQPQLPLEDPISPSPDHITNAENTDWLEPQGLNIVDLAGVVPDRYLKGAIISFTPGYGILTYESGTRVGDTVTITTTVYPRYIIDKNIGWSGSMFGCLGQPARIDQWGSTTPATTMRLYHNGEDVTEQVDSYMYVPAGRNTPIRNPQQSEWQNEYRYWETQPKKTDDHFTSNGALNIPANMGCEIIMSHQNYQQLTAIFTANVRQYISVDVVGTEQFTFHSYLGGGYAGLLDELVDQLNDNYGGRHEKFTLDIPANADYFFLNFPPMPVDAYTQFPDNRYDNVGRPSGGTYRIDGSGLSVDHVNAMGLPLYGHWKDIGHKNYDYIPHFKEPNKLAAPEYFVPAGVDYDPCMLDGSCPKSLLEEIRNTEMTMTMVYLHVERTDCEMEQIPLKMVGPGWDASNASTTTDHTSVRSIASMNTPLSHTSTFTNHVYLPLVLRRYCAFIPPDSPSSQPQGWFTEDGRMMDFVPRQ